MKTKTLLIAVALITSLAPGAVAQWTTSGNDIYNTNSGNVGIGTGSTVPNAKLYVKSTSSTALISIFNKQSGAEDIGFGIYGYLPTPTSNTYLKNTLMLYGAGASLTHLNISNAVSNGTIRFLTGGWDSSSYERMIISSSGNVGIGFSTPSYKLAVNGVAWAVSWQYPSDARFKQNITKINGSLDKISKIGGYTYSFNRDKFKDKGFPQGEQMGVLAQELQKVFPNSVTQDADGYLSVDYASLIPVMIEAIKDLKRQVDQMRSEQVHALLTNTVGDHKTSYRNANLNQNTPNPLTSSTSIEYTVPDNAYSASIIVYKLDGEQVKQIEISNKGTGTIDIASEELRPGFYLYSLVLDGDAVLTKRMIVH